MADITLGQFYNAIAQGAREATLNALKGTDFATQTTLAEILSKLSDPATQATLLDVLNKLDDLTAVKNLLTEGDAKVQLSGSFDALANAPSVGVKTVSTTAAEIFAGASRLTGRYMLAIYNDSDNVVYWGPSGVTANTGFPLFPGDTQVFRLSPTVETPVFCVAGASSSVRVVELA